MPDRGYPPASWIGMVLLVLSLPGCSTELLAPAGNEQGQVVTSAKVPVSPDLLTSCVNRETSLSEQTSPVHRVAWLTGLEESAPAAEHGSEPVGMDQGSSTVPADCWRDRLHQDIDLSLEDFQRYYCRLDNLGELALGVGLAAPLANTPADNSIHKWYQKRMRTATTDAFADVFGWTGELWIAGAVGAEAWALAGNAGDDYSRDGGIFEWSNRSLRSMAVGTPSLLALYVTLGASRPDTGDSRWHPFEDIHGVSGHTFYGAVPFLTAAEMTDNEFLKVPLFLGSFLTGWSRINNDRHYFSQVALGWWMAYLSVRRVDDTQAAHRAWTLVPTCGDGPGAGVLFRY